MVESESDSDQSNQDAASAQRSVQTGATAGSDTGMYACICFVYTVVYSNNNGPLLYASVSDILKYNP